MIYAVLPVSRYKQNRWWADSVGTGQSLSPRHTLNCNLMELLQLCSTAVPPRAGTSSCLPCCSAAAVTSLQTIRFWFDWALAEAILLQTLQKNHIIFCCKTTFINVFQDCNFRLLLATLTLCLVDVYLEAGCWPGPVSTHDTDISNDKAQTIWSASGRCSDSRMIKMRPPPRPGYLILIDIGKTHAATINIYTFHPTRQ